MVDDNDVRDYLLENPNYFQQHPDMLSLLQIPHASGSAVSLVEKQVSVLRERNVDLRHQLRDIGNTARENDQLFADTRELVLALLDADSLQAVQRSLLRVLEDSFQVEHAGLTLFEEHFPEASDARLISEAALRKGASALLSKSNAGCGALRAEEFEFLFPGHRIVGSAAAALILNGKQALGVIAVGSSDTGRYDSGTGTLFLEFVAEVLARRLMQVT